MSKKQKNFFILSLILIAIASLIYFKPVRNSAIQYPQNGEFSNWVDTDTYTQGKIHIVQSTSGDKVSICFSNLNGKLYNGAYTIDYGDRDDCGDQYIPVVVDFKIVDDLPCISIADKNTKECYLQYPDEEVAQDDLIGRKRYECLVNSGSYGCKVKDVQSYIYLTKKPIEQPVTPTQPESPDTKQPFTPTTKFPLTLILGLLSGLSILGVLLYLKTKKR